MEKKKNNIILIIIILIVLILLFGGFIVYNKLTSKNSLSNGTIDIDNSNKLSGKYENVYAFKIYDNSIYTLEKGKDDELLINYKNEICKIENCDEYEYGLDDMTIDYEYIDGKLYLYNLGYSNNYGHNKNIPANIIIYSIDLTQNQTSLQKEYEIPKNDSYVTKMVQGTKAFYYVSHTYDSTNYYAPIYKLYEFSKDSKQIKEIYNFKENSVESIIANDEQLYVIYLKNPLNEVLKINLNDSSNSVIADNLFVFYYDSISNSIVATQNVLKHDKIKIIDLNNLSDRTIEENSGINNRFYSINNTLAYYVDGITTVKIVGDKTYSIDLSKYTTKKIKKNYSYLELSDNYNVVAMVYLENESMPEKYKIDLITGEVIKMDIDNDEILHSEYLYIK